MVNARRELKHEATDIVVYKAAKQYPLIPGSYPCFPCHGDCDNVENSPALLSCPKRVSSPQSI